MSSVDIEAVEHLVDRHHAQDTSPGLAYGVIVSDTLVHSGGRGELRPGGPIPEAGTVFRIASMTKSFTAATVLGLRDDGLLRLDDPVAQHVPQAAALGKPTDDSPTLSLWHLLTMAAGLPTDDPWGDRQQDLPPPVFDESIAGGLTFSWAPGTRFEYSNTAYAVLGRAISNITGRPYADVVTERLLRPLGLASTGYVAAELAPGDRLAVGQVRFDADWERVPEVGVGAYAAMGGLFSTVADVAAWVAFLTDAYPPRDGRDAASAVLSRASRREMQQPHLGAFTHTEWLDLAGPPRFSATSYGLGLRVQEISGIGTVCGHSGGYPGFGSHMRWHRDSGLGVVVLANATYAPATRLAEQLLTALVETSGVSGRRVGADPTPAGGSMTQAAERLQSAVTRLVLDWDEDLADRVFAMNVDLDEPLARRRRTVHQLVGRLGPLQTDPVAVESDSPAHRVWWLRGPGGGLRIEIRLTPEAAPRVQALVVTGAATPSGALARWLERVVALLAQDRPLWPDDLPLADHLDPDHLSRALRVGAAWAGACTVGPVLAGDGSRETTVQLDGERLALRLALTVDGDVLTDFSLAPSP